MSLSRAGLRLPEWSPGGDGDLADEFVDSCSSASDEDCDVAAGWTQSMCGDVFIELLLDHYPGQVSGHLLCVLCYWAWRAGARGDQLAELAFPPGKHIGNYQRHLDAKLARGANSQSVLGLPLCTKSSILRDVVPTPVLAPTVELTSEIEKDTTFETDLALAVRDRQLPEAYFLHEVVREAAPGELVAPVGLYIDAVPFQDNDSILGFWVYTLITGVRHVVVVLKKSTLCHCGCKGWCTLWVVFN